MATNLIDEEFGEISIRRVPRASSVRIRLAPNGTLRASMPPYAPLMTLKHLIKRSRPQLRELLAQHDTGYTYENGMQIGKSHTLVVLPVDSSRDLSVKRHKQQIIVSLPEHMTLDALPVTRAITEVVISALRVEAKSYLPRRLAHLAKNGDYHYERVRFSHASGRWGSCSSSGTISLNIALMKLPHELIDYVLIHELSHTIELNHSDRFWELVAQGDPQYKRHRTTLKQYSPSL